MKNNYYYYKVTIESEMWPKENLLHFSFVSVKLKSGKKVRIFKSVKISYLFKVVKANDLFG